MSSSPVQHLNFKIVGEFQQKIKRDKDDFGATGCFFQFDLMSGTYDFAVTPEQYVKHVFNPFDLCVITGVLRNRNGRFNVIPTDFIKVEPENVNEISQYAEYGECAGLMKVKQMGYEKARDDSFVYQVQASNYGFTDRWIDEKLYPNLPDKESEGLDMTYRARLSLTLQRVKFNDQWLDRNVWQLTNRQVEFPRRRPAVKEEQKN